MAAERKGNGLIDLQEAGRLLGCTTMNVRHLVRTGMLRPRYLKERGRNAPMAFHPEDVSALAEVRERDSFDMQQVAASAAQAFALSRQLERRLELLEQLLGRVSWPLSTDEESVVALYAKAQDEQQTPSTSIGGVMEWARCFITMGEEYLDLTEAFTNDESCWKVFADLADIMLIAAPVDRLVFDRELEAAYGYLDVGKRNLRAMSFFYIRNRCGSHVANKTLDDEGAHGEILSLATALW